MKRFISLLCCFILIFSTVLSNAAVADVPNSEIVSTALLIIRSNEGSYASVNRDDNGALSIGFLQWHATRALNLLKDIVAANVSSAKKILTTALYNEITTATQWNTRILTTSEAEVIKELLATPESKSEQDKLGSSNILYYITHGQSLGITNPAALVYFADLENQCGGGGSARVARAALELAGDHDVTLDILHKAALADGAAGKYPSRRNKVYNYALLLGWEDTPAETYEIWMTTASINVRGGPGTSYDAVTTYAYGTYIAVYEIEDVNGYPWGRTPAGWVSLSYCSFVKNPFENIQAPTLPVSFDAGVGNLGKVSSTFDITVINGVRLTDYIVIYNDTFGSSTDTNMWGAEVTVGADGRTTGTVKLNACDSTIPKGGFVISAHGSAITPLQKAIASGDYVHYDPSTMKLSIYKSESAYIANHKTVRVGETYGKLPTPASPHDSIKFLGWYDSNDKLVTEKTTVGKNDDGKLTAKWDGKKFKINLDLAGGTLGNVEPYTNTVDAVNSTRNSGTMVIYDAKDGNLTSGTNEWGVDIRVSPGGIVLTEPVYMTHNLAIPRGGYVLSAHGEKRMWICENVKKGSYIEYNAKTKKISVWDSYEAYMQTRLTSLSGAPMKFLPTPTREGYTFDGWYDAQGKKIVLDTVIFSESDYTVTARWTANSAKLYLSAGDGKFDDGTSLKTKEVKTGEKIGTLPLPTREGYTFGGWWTEDGKIVVEVTVCDFEEKYVFAKWTQNFYYVSFDTQGGSPVDDAKIPQLDGRLPEIFPEKECYEFLGWSDTPDGEATYQPGDRFIKAVSKLYAVWNRTGHEFNDKCTSEFVSTDGTLDTFAFTCTNCGHTGTYTLPAVERPIEKGDVNGDHSINMKDYFTLSSVLKGSLGTDGLYPDINGDNSINITDLFALTAILANG